jgi:hypothetical protein
LNDSLNKSLMRTRLSSLIMLVTPVLPILANETPPPVPSFIGELSRCKIVGSKVDENTKAAEITLESATGIFTFDYHPPKLVLKKISFIVLKEASCEGLTLRPHSGKAIELKEIEGCSIRRHGGNLIVDITGLALNTLSAGGKVQFVNAYR